MSFVFGDGTGFVNDGVYQNVDSKAMRKVGIDEDAVMVFENPSVAGIDFQFVGRQLIKLH